MAQLKQNETRKLITIDQEVWKKFKAMCARSGVSTIQMMDTILREFTKKCK